MLFRIDAWVLGEVGAWLALWAMGGVSWGAEAGVPFLQRCGEAAKARRGQPRLSLAGIRARLNDERVEPAQRSRLARRVEQEERREARRQLGLPEHPWEDPPE